MDQSKREKLISSRLKTTLEIREKEQGLELNLKAEGLDRLPLRLEICIPAGVSIEHPAFALEAGAGESMILKDGYLEIHDGLTTVEIGPGFGEHSFKGHYSGEEINSAGYTVYANGYTPLEKHFSLMVKQSAGAVHSGTHGPAKACRRAGRGYLPSGIPAFKGTGTYLSGCGKCGDRHSGNGK